jgi:hypothetical protein
MLQKLVLQESSTSIKVCGVSRKRVQEQVAKATPEAHVRLGRKKLARTCVYELFFVEYTTEDYSIVYHAVNGDDPPQVLWARAFMLNLGFMWVGVYLEILNR